MSVSGIVLVGFVVAHMLGNLQVYLGPTKLDAYGAALRKLPALLWAARLTLIAAAGAHVWAATVLTLQNWRARPQGYREFQPDAANVYSRTMRWTGVLLLAFVAYHLLHFTLGTAHPDFIEGAVNHNFVSGFKQVGASVFYLVAMIGLGLHLAHGTWSMLQTLGLSHPRYNEARWAFATLVTLIVVLGNVSFPVAVLAGIVREAGQTAAVLLR